GAERRLVERDGNVEHEVVATALVELRRLDARDDVQIAGGRAAESGLALTLELDLRAVLDAGRNAHRVALRAPLAPRPATRLAALLLRSAATATAAEQAAEDVAEVEVAEVERRRPGSRTAAVARAEGVVLLALLGVREHVVGVLDLLEALLRLGVARVLVRVVLLDELAVGLLQVGSRRVLGDAECFVERASHLPPCARAHPRSRRRERAGVRGHRACNPSAAPRARFPRRRR